MSSFIYAVEGVAGQTVTDDTLAEIGLTHVKGQPEGQTVQRPLNGPGPGGVRCILVAAAGTPNRFINYRPAEQTWVKSLNGKFWIGLWNDHRPTEQSLRRASVIDGHAVKLGDGVEWLIPTARVYPFGTNLPSVLKMTNEGLRSKIEPEYLVFSEKCESLWQFYLSQIENESSADWRYDDQWWICCEAMRINYHVNVDEINALNLFTSQNLNDTGAAIVDLPKLADALKEKKKLLTAAH